MKDDTHITITAGGQTVETTGAKLSELASALKRTGAPMKETAEDAAVRERAYDTATNELRGFIERWENIESERKDLGEDQAEIMKQAKGRGYDTKVIKEVIRLRKMKPGERHDWDATVQLYRDRVGV
jgi:uncharacterized protein (UPF0335 family)